MLSSGLGAYGLGFRIGGLGFPGLGVCNIDLWDFGFFPSYLARTKPALQGVLVEQSTTAEKKLSPKMSRRRQHFCLLLRRHGAQFQKGFL